MVKQLSKQNKKMLSIVFGILILAIICYGVYHIMNIKESFNQNRPTLYLFYVDWCPHSRSAHPIIDSIEQHFGERISIERIHAEQEQHSDFVNSHNIEGYPTIKLKKSNGEFVVYNNRVTTELLKEFVTQHL